MFAFDTKADIVDVSFDVSYWHKADIASSARHVS